MVFASWGGALTEMQKAIFWDPASTALGQPIETGRRCLRQDQGDGGSRRPFVDGT